MIRPLVLRNLRHARGLLAALGIGLIAFTTMIVNIAAAFEANVTVEQLIELMPPALRTFIESQINVASFGAFVAFAFQHPAVTVPCLACMIVLGTIPAAEREATLLDLLLARPVRRGEYIAAVVITQTLVAVLLSLGLLIGVTIGLAMVDVPDEFPWTRYILCAAAFAPLLLASGGITLLFAAGARRRGPAVVRAVSLILTLFVIEVLADLWAPFATIRVISPFHYYKPIAIAVIPELPVWHPLLLLAVFGVTSFLAYVRFSRRDV